MITQWAFHNTKVVTKDQVLSSKKRSQSEFCPNEGCIGHEYFYHGANFAGCGEKVYDFRLDEFLLGARAYKAITYHLTFILLLLIGFRLRADSFGPGL